ncbi:MAG TPA: lipase family protein [Marmoricola sp.]|nr:lipase family protein [Marmoricola sp.]
MFVLRRVVIGLLVAALSVLSLLVPIQSASAAGPMTGPDPWYTYDGAKPLADYQPGDILKVRRSKYHLLGLPTPVRAVQILYRSTSALGTPTANATSVLIPPGKHFKKRVVSYQSFYDSMNPDDGPSRAIRGDLTLGGLVNVAEAGLLAPLLTHGYIAIVPDTEGQKADFAVGPVYGMNTLDSIRAVRKLRPGGLKKNAKVGLFGYSGGAIGTNWAAALAPSYAPDVNKDLVGATSGGVLVDPAHNLKYISGSLVWAGVAGMAIVGLSRTYGIDMSQYMSDYGKSLVPKFSVAGIADVLLEHPWLKWEHVVKPEYANPNTIPEYVEVANKVNLGSAPTPTIPIQVMQGTGGWMEGTGGMIPGIGTGDGVMVAGDVRQLMRQYCDAGAQVEYHEVGLSHVTTAMVWIYPAFMYLQDRFNNKPAPSNCAGIKPGNSLAPEVYQPAAD